MSLQKAELSNYVRDFKNWLASESQEARDWQAERQQRLAWFRTHLNKNQILRLDALRFAQLVKDLWAVNVWKNKDYKVAQLLKDNGLDRIRRSLAELLYGPGEIEERWDAFRSSIKGFGPSSISEILVFHDPERYALINSPLYMVLPKFQLPLPRVNTGSSYKRALKQISKVRDVLLDNGVSQADFLMTDFFIYYLLKYQQQSAPVTPTPKIRSHEAAEAALLTIGKLLGYDTYTPDASRTHEGRKLGELATLAELPEFTNKKIMESAKNIDVVWMKEEWPEYFFEVEHTTGVTSGLLRIYQASRTGAKLFIIGPSELLRKFEREIEKAPFRAIKEKYRFRSYEQLEEMYATVSEYRRVADEFLGGR